MEKEDILKIAQEKGEDERKSLITKKAQLLGGSISRNFGCALAFVILICGTYMENLVFDYITLALMIAGIGSVSTFVFAIYELCSFKKYSQIWNIIISGLIIIASIVKVIMDILG